MPTTDQTPSRTRTAGEIEAELQAARERLATNIEELFAEIHPKAVVHRQVNDAKAFASTQFEQAKETVQDEDGNWKTDRLAIIGGAVVGVIVFVLVVRGIVRKAKSSS